MANVWPTLEERMFFLGFPVPALWIAFAVLWICTRSTLGHIQHWVKPPSGFALVMPREVPYSTFESIANGQEEIVASSERRSRSADVEKTGAKAFRQHAAWGCRRPTVVNTIIIAALVVVVLACEAWLRRHKGTKA
jgi:hypothetical protein